MDITQRITLWLYHNEEADQEVRDLLNDAQHAVRCLRSDLEATTAQSDWRSQEIKRILVENAEWRKVIETFGMEKPTQVGQPTRRTSDG